MFHLFQLYYSCHMSLLCNLLLKSNMVDQNYIYIVYIHLYKGPFWDYYATTIKFHKFFTCRAPMVYPGFIFSICVIKDFGDFPKTFGQKVTICPKNITAPIIQIFSFPFFWKRKQPIFLDYKFNIFCLQTSLMIILLLSVPEFDIISSIGIHGEHVHAKNTCPKNSS
jgi:hypothetical protein